MGEDRGDAVSARRGAACPRHPGRRCLALRNRADGSVCTRFRQRIGAGAHRRSRHRALAPQYPSVARPNRELAFPIPRPTGRRHRRTPGVLPAAGRLHRDVGRPMHHPAPLLERPWCERCPRPLPRPWLTRSRLAIVPPPRTTAADARIRLAATDPRLRARDSAASGADQALAPFLARSHARKVTVSIE